MRHRLALILILGGLLILGLIIFRSDYADTLAEADAALAAGKLSKALDLYQQIADQPDGQAAVSLKIAQAHLAMAKQETGNSDTAYEAAWEAFLSAVSYEGFSQEVRRGMAESLLGMGDTLAAADQWVQVYAADPSDPSLWYQLAPTHLVNGEWEAAGRAFAALAAAEPDKSEYHYWAGALSLPSKPLQAREHLLRARQDPLFAGRTDKLVAILDENLEMGTAFAAGRLGLAYLAVGEPQLAVSQLQQAIDQAPNYAEAWAYLGLAQDQLGQNGHTSLSHALTLSSDNPLVYSLMGHHWIRQEQPQKARDALLQARELDPENPVHTADIAATFRMEHDFYTAEAWYQTAITQAPDDSAFWILLSRFHLEYLQDPEGGLTAAQQAVALAPQDPASLDAFGWAQYLNGETRLAENNLLASRQRDPSNPAVHYHLGQLYIDSGAMEQARQALEKAMVLDTNCRACQTPLLGSYGEMAQRVLEQF